MYYYYYHDDEVFGGSARSEHQGQPALRVLICGSRDWNDHAVSREDSIWGFLQGVAPDTVVIHGAARGADTAADTAARQLGLEVEPVPAEWYRHEGCRCSDLSRYCGIAGPRRNQKMLDTKDPHWVVAFKSKPYSNGTDDMIRRSKAAGLRVTVYQLMRDGAVAVREERADGA